MRSFVRVELLDQDVRRTAAPHEGDACPSGRDLAERWEPQGTRPGSVTRGRGRSCIPVIAVAILKELRDQQVRFAPRSKKLEQVDRAERLLSELDPGKTYSYEYLCYRITDYRPDASSPVDVSGEEARHDVRLFVEDVSDAADLRAEDMPEPVHTVEDLSRLFNVSTKTIARWRELGLVSRRFIFDGGRKRVGFLQSSVDRFVGSNLERVRRGERFSQLTSHERSEIIDRARRLAQAGAGPVGGGAADREAHEPQRRDDPLHAEAVRSRSTRIWRCSRTIPGR